MQELGGAQPGSEPRMANGNILYHRHYAQFRHRGWPGGIEVGRGAGVGSSIFCEFKSSLVQEFQLFWEFSLSGNFAKFALSVSLGFHDRCSGTGCKLIIGWGENCIVYSLFCIFIVMIITIIIFGIISSSVSFVVLLNCRYLNP